MKEKILVVDDDERDLKIIGDILKKNKFQVTTVKSGNEALKKAESETYDLMLIDILMPKLCGYELLHLLRKQYDGHMKIIYVTILPLKKTNVEGVDGFVQKPFSAETLLRVIRDTLSGKKVRK